ncbi:putative sodium/calcium/potassium exchanger NCKX1 [Candidatus Kuenenia stuttgartiensis]|uniref:Putative sodium/calcium/potassium exchanger NCKX1 n=3 Tax=Candidatus Kuenenia TaxID=380738 RepID=Q1PWF7_KUEST|nr:cation:proton antiporter [Candidatus Kuenenia stuttgartiensis]QII13956.1 putative sodium/calcium/potassium exchanger NCKX1 [Candidatus Kuenenia stuttgartiensis]CAJ71563.1 similar to sodium/calcium/potassium exchanger NCKX1 [Candidatus Kuenenia stuttgartiensis]
MSSYKSSLVFLIVFISLYCTDMLGAPVLEAKHLEPSNDSQPIHADTQKERVSLAVEENGTQTIAGDNQPIQTPVIEHPSPTTVDMRDVGIQTPNSNSDVITTEKEEPYTSEHAENKYSQKIAHTNKDDRPIVHAEEALSDTTGRDNIVATPTPIPSVTPTGYGQSLVEEEKEIHTPSPEGELSQAIPIARRDPHATEEHPGEESSIKEVPPQHAITTESRSDTDILAKEALSDTTAQDNTIATPMPILPVTPTGHEQSLIEEEREIHTPSPEGELSQAIPIENETPHGTEEHPEEESSIKEVPPQHAITTGSRSDTDILAKEALSDTTAQDNTLVTPMPILPVTPTVHGQSLIEEEREIHTPSPEGELSQAIPIENETPHGTEEHPEEESSIKEVPPQHAITTGSRSDTDILAKEALSDTTAQDNTLVTPMPILPVTPTVHGQSLIEEEREIHTPSPEGELSQAIPIENETPHGTEEHTRDESSIGEVPPQHSILTENHRDTEEKSVLSDTPAPAPTPTYSAASVDVEESLITGEKEEPSPYGGSKSSPNASVERLPSTPLEGFLQGKEDRDTEPPRKDAGESTTVIASGERRIAAVKKGKDSGNGWEIWHKDPTHAVILAVAIILIAAKIAEWLARRLRLPAVVGKLIVGMILGNVITFTGWDFFDFLRTMPFVKMISYFGTLILLFTAGLNTDLRALLRVGTSSLLVCLGGIIAPAGLGLMVGHFLLPDISSGTKLLLAIVLCNSSTGLLLAVLSELKAINTLEGRVMAGATILTDIIVILTFGIVSGFVVKGGGSLVGMSLSFGVAITSLIISLIVIVKYGDKFGNFLTKRLTEGLNIPIVVILSLLLVFMFGSVGLHTVIGAFVAGLFLRNVKLRNSDDKEHRNVESFIRPFYMLLVPILFVRVGAQVELGSFFNLNALLLGLAITGAAVIGKMFCSVCPIEKGINRLAIGIGMATKMEGTLILAGLGRDMGMLSDTVFSSVIMAIVFTSIICPSLLRNILLKKGCSPEILPVTKRKKELEGAVLN